MLATGGAAGRCSYWGGGAGGADLLWALGPSRQLHDAVADGVDHQRRGVLAAGFLEDVGAVLVDRALGDEQLVGDLLIGKPPADGHQNLPFAGGELLVGDLLAFAAPHAARERGEQPGAEVAAAGRHRVDGGDHVVDLRILEQKAAGSRLHHARVVALLAEHREGDDLQVGPERQRPLGGLGAVDARHGEIHEDDIGLDAGQQGEQLLAAARLAHDAAAGAAFQQAAQSVAEQRVVVDQYDAAVHDRSFFGDRAADSSPAPTRIEARMPLPLVEAMSNVPPSELMREAMFESPMPQSIIA